MAHPETAHPMLAQAFALLQVGRTQEGALLVSQLAAQGHPDAMLTLGEMKWGGMVASDPLGARVLFERAGAAGNRIAAANFTNLLASGIAGPRDWHGAMARLREEAVREPKRREALDLIDRMALDDDGDPVALRAAERISDAPDVVRFERLFTAAECAYLLKLAEPSFAPSTVYDGHRNLVRDPLRTSDGSTLHWLIEDPAVHALNRRLAAASGTDAGQGEAAQVLRYRSAQQYRAHYDFVRAADNQRVLTALVYLNHDYKGGETAFLKTGLKVAGRKGDALIFRNALPDGTVDPLTEHAGMPVASGTKYLYSRWIRAARWAV